MSSSANSHKGTTYVPASTPASVGKSNPDIYGQMTGKFLSVWTTHVLPRNQRPLRYGVILVLFLLWFSLLTTRQKVMGLLSSTFYSGVEFFFCRCMYGEFYTTSSQWFLNVLYLPAMFKFFFPFVDHSIVLFTLTFPFQVWLLEIIQGYFLIWLYGHNVAWSYAGDNVYFHGNIKLTMYHWWALLGLVIIVGWPLYIVAGFYETGIGPV